MLLCLKSRLDSHWELEKDLIKRATEQALSTDTQLTVYLQLDELKLKPLLIFDRLKQLLAELYNTSAQVLYSQQKPLFPVDICFIKQHDSTILVHPSQREYFDGQLIQSDVVSTHADYQLSNDTSLYDHVCVGGTFDHLHFGHKILLTMAAFVTQRRLVCGVVDPDPDRLKRKKYYEQMESTQVRISNVEQFLRKIKDVEYQVEPIKDDLGPSAHDGLLQAIVGSSETKQGCEMVNQYRKQNGLQELKIHLIDLISESSTRSELSDKMSSTNLRQFLSLSKQ
ncbi:hypothetical protein EDD86DRAFT_190476 [Gorgonomyces haynaldii]|nr:hypothetical protein EDD86DRAFT_190476 [Gorgonomyces haynaldii]